MLTLAGIVKDILLVALSVAIFGSPVTPLQYAGYSVALLGLNLHKEFQEESRSDHAATRLFGIMRIREIDLIEIEVVFFLSPLSNSIILLAS